MAAVIPRSLKEPVGLSPSTLSQTSAPLRPESHSECTSGVPPSRRVTAGVPSGMSSSSRYSSMTPRHWWRARRCAAVAVIRPRPSTRITEVTSRTISMPAQVLDRRGELGVGGRVGDDDELGVVVAALLAHGRDRDAVLGEGRATVASTPARSSTSIATW